MYRVSLVGMQPETEAQLEGAINLWRYKGRATLVIVAIVVGLLIFAHVDAASDPGPTNQSTQIHHVSNSGPNSNDPAPVFKPPAVSGG